VTIRRLFEKKSVKLVSKFSFSSKSKRTLKHCFGLTRAGTCPDWRGHTFVWPEGDLASALRASKEDPIGLFREGLLPVEFLKNDGEEIEYSDLLKFGQTLVPTETRRGYDDLEALGGLGMEWYTKMRNLSVGQRFGQSLGMRYCF
jgi:hypothetical protein